jgi:hypothetical protein
VQQTDIIYRIGRKCDWEGYEELRYSIRSLEQNFQDLGKIYIVGVLPDWATNVIHLPHIDCYRTNKDGNLISKVIHACAQKDITEKAIVMSDDQYIVEHITIHDLKIPVVCNRLHIPGSKGRWQMRFSRTIKVLAERGFPVDCFEGHCPYMISTKEYPKVLLQYDYGHDIGYCGNTLYFNTLNHINTDDSRVAWASKGADLSTVVAGKHFLNMNYGLDDTMKNWLQEKFPKKSWFEK